MASTRDTIRRDTLVDGVSSLFTDPRYSDLKIKSGGRSWNVHKAIVCMRCNFFDAACEHPFKEATSACITLDGDEPDAVNAFLEYIYTSDFKDDNEENLSLYVLAATIGDKYTLPELVSLATEKFSKGIADIIDWEMKPSEFTRAVALLYSGSDNLKKLRSIVVNAIMAQGDKILPYSSPSALRGVVGKAPPLTVDLFCKSQQEKQEEAQRQQAQRQQPPIQQVAAAKPGWRCPACMYTSSSLKLVARRESYSCKNCDFTLTSGEWQIYWRS